jgi:hypothetical protein
MTALQIKLAAVGVVLLLLGGLFWHDRHITKKLDAKERELAGVNATLEAERKDRAHERDISEAASHDYESRLAALDAARAAVPARPVRLCREPTADRLPTTTAAAGGTDARAATEQPGAPGEDPRAGPDIGPALYSLADEADERAAQCNALIGWIRRR